MSDLPKRTWCYAQPPRAFEVAPCACGNNETQWSEFQKHLWCDKCQKDFIPEHNGIFDGPVLVGVCRMFGIVFDRINLETQQLEILNEETNEYIPQVEQPT